MLTSMLHEFLVTNRDEILTRSRAKLATRKVPTPTEAELENGLPMFMDQLIAILRTDDGEHPPSDVNESASRHGGDLLRLGLTVGQVVHDYGSICQTVTELADERNVSITADEFHTFNGCLDDAIAQAVTEFQHQRDKMVGDAGAAHLGHLAHEMRNLLSTSTLSYGVLLKGHVGIQGSTGKLLGRSLRRMRILIDRTLTEVRLGADTAYITQRVSVAELIEEIEIVATIEAKERDVQLSIETGSSEVFVEGDHQILASAIANLVQNAFKFTRAQGHITVRAHTTSDRVRIDIADECGGLPTGKIEDLFTPFAQRGADRTGLGLGLSISRKGIRASGGDIHVSDVPGHGCVFTVDLPKAPALPNDEPTSL